MESNHGNLGMFAQFRDSVWGVYNAKQLNWLSCLFIFDFSWFFVVLIPVRGTVQSLIPRQVWQGEAKDIQWKMMFYCLKNGKLTCQRFTRLCNMTLLSFKFTTLFIIDRATIFGDFQQLALACVVNTQLQIQFKNEHRKSQILQQIDFPQRIESIQMRIFIGILFVCVVKSIVKDLKDFVVNLHFGTFQQSQWNNGTEHGTEHDSYIN